jgi:hypothetical protein
VAFEQSIEINKLSRKLNAFSLPFLVIYNDTKAALSYFKGFLYDLNQERFLKEKSLEFKRGRFLCKNCMIRIALEKITRNKTEMLASSVITRVPLQKIETDSEKFLSYCTLVISTKYMGFMVGG